tara:strand:+ start:10 stop:339 length:330 start_codon:yes stop_codon:yes gene_type:complete
MSILRHIRKIPLFSTPLEAIAWGRSRGLKGYHSHAFGVKTGYMGGANHHEAMKFYVEPTPRDEAIAARRAATPIVPQVQPQTQPEQNAPAQRIIPPSSGSSSGGGGGGY